MNASVGPLTISPTTIGLTATTGAGVVLIASAIDFSASIGPIEMTGFDGPITTARAAAIALSASGVGDAAALPVNSTPSTVSFPRCLIKNSCRGPQPSD